jgi:prolyl oligopeptidase PreP (S9A serine peptidase family)
VAITRRPELFGAAAARSGIFDMLRLHVMGGYRKFANPEFGSAGLDTDFPAIAAYTPLQHRRGAPFCSAPCPGAVPWA